MDRKAQGTTFWIIIAAVIALVVLIVVLVIFTGKTGDVSGGLLDCESKGGFCEQCDATKSDVSGACDYQCKQKDGSYSSVFSCPKTPAGSDQGCCLGVKAE